MLTQEQREALSYLAPGCEPVGRGTTVSLGMARELHRLGLVSTRGSSAMGRFGGLTDDGLRALGLLVPSELARAGKR